MSSTSLDFITINTEHPLYKQVYELRETILRQPLGLSLQHEDLSGDKTDTIVIAVENGVVVGCVMMKPVNEHVVKLRQMAVSKELQQKGLGRRLIQTAENIAWTMGFNTISLHARCSAASFYTKLGYEQEGDIFEEVTIPHIVMHKHK